MTEASERMEQIKVVLRAMEESAGPPCQACDGTYDALEARREALYAEVHKTEAELRGWRACQACTQASEAQDARRHALINEWQQLNDEQMAEDGRQAAPADRSPP